MNQTFHPCFNENSQHKYARMHVAVAPACNISCRYCNRKFDCIHESRPGVTSKVISPEEALEKFLLVRKNINNIKVIGFAGPGDALANFDNVHKSINLIKKHDPEMIFCLSTNGLMLPYYIKDIVKLGISHVTVTINSIDPKIGALIYEEINYEGDKFSGEEGAALLLENQLKGLELLSDHKIMCKVNTVAIKEVNYNHIVDVVRKIKEFGVSVSNIMPLIPAQNTPFENMPLICNTELNELRKKAALHLSQMYHCRQCRSDAVGLLSHDRSYDLV